MSILRTAGMVLLAIVQLGAHAALASRKPPPANIHQLWKNYQQSVKPALPASVFPFQECFEQAAVSQQLPLTLLLAVARGESDFDPKTISKANARGVMQIRWPETARDLGFSPEEQQQQQQQQYDLAKKTRLLHFSRPYQAEGYVNALAELFPEFRFDWFKSKDYPGEFDAFLVYRDEQDKSRALLRLREENFVE